MAKPKKERQAGKGKPAAPRPAPEAAALPRWLAHPRLHAGLLFAFAFLLYANTLGNGYAQDDAIVITDNMFTTQGVRGIPGILRYDTFYGFFKEEGKANLVSGGRYRPFSLVTFALEVSLFGQNPLVSHLINALFYGLTAVVLYFLLLQWFQPERKDRAYGYFVALVATAIFTAHPLHTEAVANIKGRDEILALLGSLLAVLLVFRAYRRKQAIWLPVAGLSFLLALFSKENAITFLAVTPLALLFFTRADAGAIVRAMLPLVAATVLFLFVRGSILGWQLGEPTMEMMNNPFVKVEGNKYVPFTGAEKLATITYTMGKYLQLLVAPLHLTHDYYPRHIGIMHWSDPLVILSLLVYLFLIGYAVWGWKRRDPVSFGILYFLATVSIVSNLVFPVGTNMSERLVYMPSVGYALVAAVLLYRLGRLVSSQRTEMTARRLAPGLAVAVILVLLYGGRTVARNPAWKSDFTLFSTDIAVSANSAKLRNALGGELITQSLKEKDEAVKKRMLTEAVGHLQQAIRIHPNYKNAYLLLGNAHYYLQEWDQAITYYRQALSLDSAYEEARGNLAITYRDAGRYFGEQLGDLPKAIQYLEQAYALRSDDYETARLLGVAYGIGGDTAKAIQYFSRAVELEPDSADALYNLGSAYYQAGQPERGRELHEKALQLDPEVAKRMQQGQ